MKKSLIFIVGITVGILATILANSYFQGNNYAILNKDYTIPNGGLLKKGTKIKRNGSFPEGFTQYQLYINIPNWTEDELFVKKEKNAVIPYWAEPKGSTEILEVKCDSISENGEILPKFIGGDKKLAEFNWNNILPIIQEFANKNEEGGISKLIYSLVISKDGKVLSSLIETDISEDLKVSLEKELQLMPNWIPGRENGRKECMKVRIPISCVKWD